MKHEFFPVRPYQYGVTQAAVCSLSNMYRQERDWTCGLACVRTIAADLAPGFPSEDDIVQKYQLTPGPLSSEDIKRLGLLELPGLEVQYGCDIAKPEELDPSVIWSLISRGYRVMTEWMMSYDHWTVILGYFPDGHDQERSQLLYWCPYFGEMRMVRAGDFEVMWHGGLQRLGRPGPGDFIAVRKRECT